MNNKEEIKAGFFIQRPIFATVISIIITLVGLIAIQVLPIERYPNLTPPQVSVSANYNGADAETIAQNVASILESQIFGVEDMIYMNSVSSSAGYVNVTVTFAIGTDPDLATINVNNKVQTALARLPTEVQQLGITVTKRNPSMLMLVSLVSVDNSYSKAYLANYASLNVVDELKQVSGVGEVSLFGKDDYSIRVWLDPNKLAYYNLIPADVANVIRSQNAQFAAGSLGAAPMEGKADVYWQVLPPVRYSTPEEFGEIIVRSNSDGSSLRLKDIARIELGAETYGVESRYNGQMATAMAIYLSPDANALATANAVKARVEELSKNFPDGIEHRFIFDNTKFIVVSIKEVVKTLIEALILVVIIVYVFLQSWRATLIPSIAVPVSIIGTFAGMYALGFSINILTMFAMVLAIGMVVDDAIIVVENVERLMATGLSVRQATAKAMNEVTRPVIAVVLVLSAVFIPVAFMGGLAGVMYKQFAITIVISVVISGIVALTFTPALCMLLLKHGKEHKHIFHRGFNKGFEFMTQGYLHGVKFILRNNIIALIMFGATLGGIGYLFTHIPTGLVPSEDQGVVIAFVQLPDGTAIDRTAKYMENFANKLKQDPSVEGFMALAGFDMLASSVRPNSGAAFIDLKHWDERKTKELSSDELVKRIGAMGYMTPEGISFAFNPSPIPGMGATGGFEMWIQNRAGDSTDKLYQYAMQIVAAAREHPELTGVRTTMSITAPQLQLEVDKEKALAMGVSISDIFSVLSATFGQSYVNDFNLYGRSYKVYAQADAEYRSTPSDLEKLYVRSGNGDMVPLATMVSYTEKGGAYVIERYNNFPATKIIGNANAGYSSGEAMAAIEQVAKEILPRDYTLGWSGQAYQERVSSGSTVTVFVLAMIMVFLILAAQYESWSLPFAVVISIPFAALGAGLATYLKGFSNDIYFQVALVTLVGLAAKNAILIVEFAVERYRAGGCTLEEAAFTGAQLRFRPIIMTSLAFIFGTIPLAVSSGAGAASRNVLGIAVVGGMIFATILLPLFVPFFFKWIMWISLKLFPERKEGIE